MAFLRMNTSKEVKNVRNRDHSLVAPNTATGVCVCVCGVRVCENLVKGIFII